MSASLVGSEMCIRDSLLPCATFARGVRECESAPNVPTLHGPEDCWIPVSYTHLTLPTICSV
eukprot:11914785-Alexandrium_andersonii.AAC.1